MVLGEPGEAEQAAAWGMIWRAVADDDLAAEAASLAGQLARQPAGALALIKQALAASPGHDLDRQLDLERDLQRMAGRQADFREGIAAFREKRPARFARLR
jgi:2-(1,2-epoxy-1,2-dihydrophenyl)acetyl-CoA isomerase